MCIYIYLKYFCIEAFGKQTTVTFLRYSVVMLEQKNCCSLESLSLIPLTCFPRVFHITSRIISLYAAVPASWRDAGMLLWELLPLSSLLEVGLKDLWCHLHVKRQLGVPEHPVKGLCHPWHRGLWESSKSSWGFVLLALLKPEPGQQPPNGTGDRKVATWEMLDLDQHADCLSACWSYTVADNKWI